jgi:4-amino-4-deoxy-L-arabinose transferase-like glycosyltransferase
MPRRNVLVPLLVLLGAKLLLHLVTNQQYGFHRDELATVDDARHLAWGYVAYPPLTPFVGRIALVLFGPSMTGIRFFAALAQCAAIAVAALMARDLGGDRWAQLTAAIAVAVSPISLAASSLFQYVSFDFLWWVLIAWFVIRLIVTNDARWWLAIGATIGLGVLTKYTIAFFIAGIVAAVLFTPLRAHLRSRWLWIGAALSIAIAAPNLVWQATHGFVSLEFLRHIHARDVRIGRTAHFFVEQLYLAVNPLTLPLWIAGLVAVWREPRLRPIGWLAVVPFALFALAHGRGYYTAPLYPMLLAAGAVSLERVLPKAGRIAIATAACIGALFALLIVPIAPIGSKLWQVASGVNSDLREEVGWPELVAEVARIHAAIPAAERARTAIYCGNYGEAGAIDLYGPAHGLPQAISGINSYWARGYGNTEPNTVIVLGSKREELEEHFTSVELAGRIANRYGVKNEETTRHPEIFVCRGLHERWADLWPKVRSFG